MCYAARHEASCAGKDYRKQGSIQELLPQVLSRFLLEGTIAGNIYADIRLYLMKGNR